MHTITNIWRTASPLAKGVAIALLVLWLFISLACIAEAIERPTRPLYAGNKWGLGPWIWHPITLFVPMLGSAASVLLASAFGRDSKIDGQKWFALFGLLGMSALMALSFRPDRGLDSPNLLGIFVPLFMQGVVVYLFIGWTKPLWHRLKPNAL